MGNTSPFDATAAGYDAEFTHGNIGALSRARFWRLVGPHIGENAEVLELGGGTGEDACHFATRGARITLTDASHAMIETAQAKVRARGLEDRVKCLPLDMNRLHEAPYRNEALGERRFDAAYANFGALNCVANLSAFSPGLAQALRPGAPVFLTVMGPAVPWEWAWYLARAQPAKAFRRLKRGGATWRGMKIFYPSPRSLARALAPHFTLRSVAVVNAFVPPSYCETAFASRQGLLARLNAMDDRLVDSFLIARLADHYLAHFVRN